ncbi:MAG: hypothetical protein EOO65_06070 [Methanosarcinales archaeon]|nr:MAG: hypothetical protein EOO65_06070 [Methanosarcinales archaeon]
MRAGFASLSKGEVSNDFRLISGLPQLHPVCFLHVYACVCVWVCGTCRRCPLHVHVVGAWVWVQADAPQDALLNSTTRLHVDLRAGLPADQPEPEAAFSRQDEKPQVVQALEAAAFQGRMEEDEGVLRAPAVSLHELSLQSCDRRACPCVRE